MTASASQRPAWILPVIVLSPFAATSLWFAANAVLPDLQVVFDLPANAVGLVTSAVQFGFVAGTLVFALLTLSDRFSPSTVFLVCALLGAACNAGVFVVPEGLWPLLVLRFATGFFLAGHPEFRQPMSLFLLAATFILSLAQLKTLPPANRNSQT